MGMIHYIRRGSKLRIMAGDCPAWITNSKRASYIMSVVLSAPLWVRFADFKGLHERAIWMSAMTHRLRVLDHIIPLNHPRVCGLTVPWNLQVVDWRLNASKGNSWCPEQEDLFPELLENR